MTHFKDCFSTNWAKVYSHIIDNPLRDNPSKHCCTRNKQKKNEKLQPELVTPF